MQIHDFPPYGSFQFDQDVHVAERGIFEAGTGAEDADTTDPMCFIRICQWLFNAV